MIIYNITCKVDWAVQLRWIQWVQESYIPEMLSHRLFHHGQLVKLLDADETDGPTYALQFYTKTLDNYRRFQTGAASSSLQHFYSIWKESVLTFSTVMQLVE